MYIPIFIKKYILFYSNNHYQLPLLPCQVVLPNGIHLSEYALFLSIQHLITCTELVAAVTYSRVALDAYIPAMRYACRESW